MPLRITLLILAFLLFTNLLIVLASVIANKNLYKTHGKLILNAYGILAFVLIVVYFTLSFIGIIE